jgi:hypothetical protein
MYQVLHWLARGVVQGQVARGLVLVSYLVVRAALQEVIGQLSTIFICHNMLLGLSNLFSTQPPPPRQGRLWHGEEVGYDKQGEAQLPAGHG